MDSQLFVWLRGIQGIFCFIILWKISKHSIKTLQFVCLWLLYFSKCIIHQLKNKITHKPSGTCTPLSHPKGIASLWLVKCGSPVSLTLPDDLKLCNLSGRRHLIPPTMPEHGQKNKRDNEELYLMRDRVDETTLTPLAHISSMPHESCCSKIWATGAGRPPEMAEAAPVLAPPLRHCCERG